MARGLDIEDISHVISFDTPDYPENYIHRIGRAGRAEKQGHTIVFATEKEQEAITKIESLMQFDIPVMEFPDSVEISSELIEEERPHNKERYNPLKRSTDDFEAGEAFHEKKEKNRKENLGGSYQRKIKQKYKKPKTRGDKNYNKRNKKRR